MKILELSKQEFKSSYFNCLPWDIYFQNLDVIYITIVIMQITIVIYYRKIRKHR